LDAIYRAQPPDDGYMLARSVSDPNHKVQVRVEISMPPHKRRRELDHFIGAIARGTTPLAGGGEGVKALALADAALESFRTGRPVRV
jgi:predicted dehydrogenase